MKLVRFTCLLLIASLSGCAVTEPSAFELTQNRQVRLLALDCYNNREGFRLVYGGAAVWEACWVQAERKVRGSLSNLRE